MHGPEAIVTNHVALLPVSLEVPGAKTLVEWIIASEMAVLDEANTLVPTENKADLLVVAHC